MIKIPISIKSSDCHKYKFVISNDSITGCTVRKKYIQQSNFSDKIKLISEKAIKDYLEEKKLNVIRWKKPHTIKK